MNEPIARAGALVTGGGIRLGRAIALGLAERGHDIVVHYRHSEQAARETAAEIETFGVKASTLSADLTRPDGLSALIDQALSKCPNLGVLVNSASGYAQSTIGQSSIAEFDNLFAANLRAPFFLTQAFAARVGSGNVINILDNKIGFNQHKYAAYLLTKKALAEFTRLAAIEFAPAIRVNGVAPGVVMPAATRSESYLSWRVDAIPLRTQGQSTHVAAAIAHLLDNTFVTGQILTVDGGENIANLGRNAGEYDQNLI